MAGPQWHRHHHIITQSHPSPEVRRQSRSAWRWLFPVIAVLAALGIGMAVADKAIPQAAYDACAAYCEEEIE